MRLLVPSAILTLSSFVAVCAAADKRSPAPVTGLPPGIHIDGQQSSVVPVQPCQVGSRKCEDMWQMPPPMLCQVNGRACPGGRGRVIPAMPPH